MTVADFLAYYRWPTRRTLPVQVGFAHQLRPACRSAR
jgi:hypothetical protein